MFRRAAFCLLSTSLVSVALLSSASLVAEEKKADNPAAKLINRDVPRHKQFLEIAKKGDVDVLFLGDSITQGWEGAGKEAWKKNFEPLKAANFGIGGDQTGHVLWRLTEGKELEGIQPKVAVIMIGTNNTGGHGTADIAGGVTEIVSELRKQRPHCKILLLGVFPRGSSKDIDKETMAVPADKLNPKIKQINDIIAKLDDGKTVFYKDIGAKFLGAKGELPKDVMPDFLHLSPKGYAIETEAILPDIQKLLK